MKNCQYLKKQNGLTLVEILVAITLSAILLTGVIKVFVATNQSYRVQDSMSRIQENGRFGIEIIAKDIQMAGFDGCNGGTELTNNLKSTNNLQYQYAFPLQGFDNVATTPDTFLTNAGINPDANTDVIIIRRPKGEPFRMTDATTSDNVFMEVVSTVNNACTSSATMVNGFCPGDIMMIADCTQSTVFQSGTISVSGTSPNQVATITHPSAGTPGNANDTWGGTGDTAQSYLADANTEIYHVDTIVYYVATTNNIPTLFRFEAGQSQALVDNIEDIQIRYGRDTSGDGVANSVVTAPTFNDQAAWESIVSVKLNLLVRSNNNNISETTLDYIFNGNTVQSTTLPSSDRYVRREFATTVAIRNHSS